MAKQTIEEIKRVIQGEWENAESRDIDHGTQFILPECRMDRNRGIWLRHVVFLCLR